jgi:hypothetical protein
MASAVSELCGVNGPCVDGVSGWVVTKPQRIRPHDTQLDGDSQVTKAAYGYPTQSFP